MVFVMDKLWLAYKSNNRASTPHRDYKKTDTPTWRHREVTLSFISVNSNKLKLQVISHQPTPGQSGVAQRGQVPAPLKDLGCRTHVVCAGKLNYLQLVPLNLLYKFSLLPLASWHSVFI